MTSYVLAALIGLALWGIDVTVGQGDKLRLCYFSNRAQYRQDEYKFTPDDIDPYLCSHIVYSHANIVGTQVAYLEWNDVSAPWREGMYAQTIKLKEVNPALKIIISVGGPGFDIRDMSLMLATIEQRQLFILSAIDFLRTHGFDGIDLNMDYPGTLGTDVDDKNRYANLVQELRDQFDVLPGDDFTVSVTTRCEDDIIDTAYAIGRIQQYADWVGLKTYEMSEGMDSYTRLYSPLYARDPDVPDRYKDRTMEWCVNRWVSGGAPRNKLVLGLGAWGRGFILATPEVHGLYSPTYGRAYIAPYTHMSGVRAYYEICQLLSDGGTRVWREDYGAPYVYKDKLWYGYDDIQSLQKKVQWLLSEGLAGYLAWTMDLDDFTGMSCGQGRYPLLTTMNNTLYGRDPPQGGQNIPAPPASSTIVSVSTTPIVVTTTKSPDELCAGKVIAYVLDPGDCSKFYMCWNSVPYDFSCPTGLYFNTVVSVCDWAFNLSDDRRMHCGL